MKRILFITTMLLTLLAALAFAGGSKEQSTGSSSKPSGTLWVVYRAPIWADSWINPNLAAFKKKYPDVKIQLQNIPHTQYTYKMQLMFASSNVPDIFEENLNQDFDFFASLGLLENLTPFIKSTGFDIGKFDANVIKRLTKNGGLYMMPIGTNPGIGAIAYNKTYFEKAGLSAPPKDWTYADLLKDARALTKTDAAGKITQFGVAAPVQWMGIMPVLHSWGGGWIDSTAKKSLLEDPATVAAYQWVSDLLNKYHVSPRPGQMPDESTQKAFLSGQVAMYFMGGWEIGTIKQGMAKGYTPAIAPLPVGPKGRIAAVMNIDSFAMAAKAKNKTAAWAFLSWLGSDQMLTQVETQGLDLSTVPKLLDLPVIKNNAWEAPFADSMRTGHYVPSPIPANFRVGEMRQAITQGLDPVWAGTQPLDQALKATNAQVQQILDKPAPGLAK